MATLVFIFKTCSDQILAKSSIREVDAALFSSRRLKTYKNEKLLLGLKIAEVNIGGEGGQFWAEKNDSGH